MTGEQLAEGDVDRSWKRSAALGLSPVTAGPNNADTALSRARRLREAAEPVMESVDDILGGTGATVVLADQEGRILRSAEDGTRVAQMLRRRGISEGADLSEDSCGNNGIGTVLETRAGVRIAGEQHFAEVFKPFSCYGHPIINPLTRRLVGAIDLTGLTAEGDRFFVPFVRQIVASIEARYVDTARTADRELYSRFMDSKRTSRQTVCAFGEEAVLVSRRGLDVLSSADLTTLREAVESADRPDRVALSIGEIPVAVQHVGRSGRLVELDIPSAPQPTPRPKRRAATAAGPGARRASTLLSSCAVLGPAGSGRTTMAVATAGADAVHVRLADADDADAAWRDLALPALRASGEGSGSAVILDDVDLLSDADLRRLGARMAKAHAPIVVTSYDVARPAVMAVAEQCDRTIHTSGLHEREEEGIEIVRAMVAQICRRREFPVPVITEQFAREACALELPNNLRSLESILADCLRKPVRILEPAHLPAHARSARIPRPGELARGEYEAIVSALDECDGVRSRAAKRLGISRTTLYARLREFGLD
ncbi:helix-turn-helix domain-containing protein [Dietzia timorensis]|uniref:Signal-transduction and transcriptional-control protein n=3 Tax=Dietzia timorensis TaxID=499555 RepID=A0A173LIL9_9ACTN|nr:helix-turn-helix domain-containing protein [Dietzia timorensis]ANI91464.1 Signal-transduction and transcriptional-control protein [Dietzia timorensis]